MIVAQEGQLAVLANPDPIGELYQRVVPGAFRLARAILLDAAAAEDVVHEAFLRVLRRRERLREGDALDAYVTRAVRNLAYNQLRSRRSTAAVQAQLERQVDLVELPADAGEDAALLAPALNTLPAQQREVVHLRVFEGLAFKEIAARTGVPLGTVHSRYRYALSKLRGELEEVGHDG